jgi:hypothetical protein
MLAGWLMGRTGAGPSRAVYQRAIAPFAGLVLGMIVVTSLLVR